MSSDDTVWISALSGYRRNSKRGGVCGKHALLRYYRLKCRKCSLLNLEALHHRFYYQFAIGKLVYGRCDLHLLYNLSCAFVGELTLLHLALQNCLHVRYDTLKHLLIRIKYYHLVVVRCR